MTKLTEQLELRTYARIYEVAEREIITEHDSPAPGAMQVVKNEGRMYCYFISPDTASTFIATRQHYFQAKNPTLKYSCQSGRDNTKDRSSKNSSLVGTTSHHFSHIYEIIFGICPIEILLAELPENLEALLLNPKVK